MARLFSIDPDIRRAETPPGWLYSDAEVFEQQRDAVFAPSWQLALDAHRLPAAGTVAPCVFLEGILPEPLAITRDEGDHWHALSNVCTHRANLVVEVDAAVPVLRCRYHGRRFGLDGRFRSMPEFEQAEGFPTAADDLPRVALGRWSRLVFTALAPAIPFEEWVAPLATRVGGMTIDHAAFDPTRSRDYDIAANWALYVDNYLEGFHIPYVHSSLNAAIDYGSYSTEALPHGVLQVGHARGEVAAYYLWLWPNLMFNVYPWGFSVNVVKPIAVDRTRVSFLTWVVDPSRLDQGAGAGLDGVELEDEAVVQGVMQGTRARLYGRGRYSPTREVGVHRFHRLLAAALGGAEPES
ncbi:MAG: SRPBCC family protein [Candidatus Eisenbacteria bacterium]